MRSTRRSLGAVAVLVLAALGLASPAVADPSCTFAAPTLAVAVGEGETATIARAGDAITLNGADCGGATVTTTDTIAITATGAPTEIAIDQSGGRFEPGATVESDESSEIEFTIDLPTGTPSLRVIGTAEADQIVIGADGINLNAGEATGDADVTFTGTPQISIEGGAGNDEILGDDQANILVGGDGDDTIDGGGEADTLIGGAGTDTVSFASSNKGVTVDLKQGTAEGDGADTLDGFEDVEGTRKADEIQGNGAKNTLDGSGGPDSVGGGNGVDEVLGGDGNDLLFGEKGNDLLKGADGRDQLNGGKGHDRCKGGNDPDSFVFCENV